MTDANAVAARGHAELPAPAAHAPTAEGISPSLLTNVADWIMEAALADTPMDALLDGACTRLHGAGLPLERVHLSYRTLHPSIESVSLLWTTGKPVEALEHMHGAGSSEVWRRSPFHFMIEKQLPALRRRLTGPGAVRDFLVLDDLADEGMTDYLGLMVKFDRGEIPEGEYGGGILTSWTTGRPNGFVDADIAALLRVKQRLGVAAKMAIRKQIASNVVATYLGQRAGEEVLSGRIRRGDGQTIHAVIWYSDLRGSSALADSMPSSRYIALLNGYFECAAGAVIDSGGEVLNYIGDGVLAIFPMDSSPASGAATGAALEAALEARRRLEDVNDNLVGVGAEPLDFGVAMHVGDVVFGNVGAGARLSFTTIGAAVNEVSRLESMTKTFKTPLLMSGEFKAALDPKFHPILKSYGFHELRGIGAPMDIYGLDGSGAYPA